LPAADSTGEDALWLYHDRDRQALILSRTDSAGKLSLRYLPVSGLIEDLQGKIRFEAAGWAAGFPLHIWEDKAFGLPGEERAPWLATWHSEIEWLRAVHKTEHSDGILALDEQFLRTSSSAAAGDDDLIERFSHRKRALSEPDFLIFANDHWNFNVRGFNPGGNHGSFRRISMRSVLMLAGGAETGIGHDLAIDEPYDSLSFVPTVLELMGKNEDARKLPGRPIRELLTSAARSAPAQ